MKRFVIALVGLVLLAGCGSDDEKSTTGSGAEKPTLTVSAATSLKKALTTCGEQYERADVRFSFAGSDELAAQIRQGAKPDVYAAANTKLPEALAKEGKLAPPTVFAGNRLVLAVPEDGTVSGLDALAEPGTKLVIGDPDVPVGSYTREVLGRLPADEEKAILANVRSEEPDVGGVVAKLTQGAADAGFTYITDVVGTDGALKAVEIPDDLQPSVAYGAGVVKGSENQSAAQAFVEDMASGACAKTLREAGFTPPPT